MKVNKEITIKLEKAVEIIILVDALNAAFDLYPHNSDKRKILEEMYMESLKLEGGYES